LGEDAGLGTGLPPAGKRAGRAGLNAVPRAWGGWRTRWSCATLALEVQARRGLTVSGETVRRGLQEVGWGWQRAQLGAKDEDPQRVEKLARSRLAVEQWRAGRALFVADELAMSRLPKVGSQGMPKGGPVAGVPPGTTEKRSLAGALTLSTGTIARCLW
jgi:hypothetical protein